MLVFKLILKSQSKNFKQKLKININLIKLIFCFTFLFFFFFFSVRKFISSFPKTWTSCSSPQTNQRTQKFSRETNTQKTQKIQFKNKIIYLKALISQTPAKSSNPKATSPESSKLENHQIPEATTHSSSITKLTLKPRARPPHFLNHHLEPRGALIFNQSATLNPFQLH